MSDLISKGLLIEHLDACLAESDGHTPLTDAVLMAVRCAVEQMPTVDAVEVVRCKDCCKWKDFSANKGWGGKGYCRFSEYTTLSDDFCSYGERKEVSE